jgi:hypothetical protein
LRVFFTEDPDSIIVELDFRGSIRGTGEKIASKVLEQFDFIDGKISAITLFWFNIPKY